MEFVLLTLEMAPGRRKHGRTLRTTNQQIAPDSFQSPRGEGLVSWMETKLLNGGEDTLVRVCDQAGEAVGFVHAVFLSPHEEADRQVTRDIGFPRVFVNALAVQRAS